MRISHKVVAHRSLVGALIIVAWTLPAASAEDLTAGLSPEKLGQIRSAVDRGLEWLATQQKEDGSYASQNPKDSMTTCYALMAYLARGHQPDKGRYGRQLGQAIDFLLSTQREDGSFSLHPAEILPPGLTHPLTALALCESSGLTSGDRSDRIRRAIERALRYSRNAQERPKIDPAYVGGWMHAAPGDWSTIAGTAFELSFLRSAQNSGFQVPRVWIDEGLSFVERCYFPGPRIVGDLHGIPVAEHQGVFYWFPKPPPGRPPWWANFYTTSCGMIAFELHGRRDDPRVLRAAAFVAEHPIPQQGSITHWYQSCYIASRAMAQLGGEHWKNLYPRIVDVLLPLQEPDGHWRLERTISWGDDDRRGPACQTALAILTLTMPDQLLPIHQR